MPLEWIGSRTGAAPEISGAASYEAGDPPLARLHLWPHRSLRKSGFVFFIAATFALILLPMLAVLGTPVMWGLMPFMFGTLALVWAMLARSYRDGEVLEDLMLWSDHACLVRRARRGPEQRWEANPYWVSVQIHGKGGPVESYLTLKGAGREVELGAFLTAEEREALHPVLAELLRKAAGAAPDRPGGPGMPAARIRPTGAP